MLPPGERRQYKAEVEVLVFAGVPACYCLYRRLYYYYYYYYYTK